MIKDECSKRVLYAAAPVQAMAEKERISLDESYGKI